MSRGIETIDTVSPTGSSEATIMVSVRNVDRPTPASTPISSTLTRGTSGTSDGSREAEADGSAEASGSTAKSGSLEATGTGLESGTHVPPSPTGA